jgi:hypothetical protein
MAQWQSSCLASVSSISSTSKKTKKKAEKDLNNLLKTI